MATLTLKNLPDHLHRELKQQAAANHRSLNSEVIASLEAVVRSRPVDPEAFLAKVRPRREGLGFKVTQEEVDRYKRHGRP